MSTISSENVANTLQNSYRYAIFMETNGEEFESWYNFIRYEGNEEALQHLQKHLDKVDFYILDDMSTFDLDIEHLVSEDTARQMCLVDLNAFMFHRKFNGKLEKIDFGFSRKDDNEDLIEKVHEKLGFGDIDKYVDDEEEFKNDNESVSSRSSRSSRSSGSDLSDNDSLPSQSPSPPRASKKKAVSNKDKVKKKDR
jgi:hypothetical protein